MNLARSLEACERIAARDGSNLYRVSQHFADRTRYDAFVAMYAVMRVVDDTVDDRKLPAPELFAFLDAWERRVEHAYWASAPTSEFCPALARALATFPIPAAIWARFFRAMRYDVGHTRFPDEQTFATYAEGATDAPTTIFLYLLTSSPVGGRYLVDGFDYLAAGSALGRFAYLTHILRDVAADLRAERVYIPAETLAAHALDEHDLATMIARGRGDHRWSALVAATASRARALAEAGVAATDTVKGRIGKDCAFILDSIVDAYRQLLQRLASDPDLCLRS